MAKSYSDKERIRIMNKIEEEYHSSKDISIKKACKAAGISDATYYNWKHRFNEFNFKNENMSKSESKSKNSKKISSDKEQKIVNLKKDKPFLGFKKISKQMVYSYGIKISSRKVKKILKENDLAITNPPRPKKKKI